MHVIRRRRIRKMEHDILSFDQIVELRIALKGTCTKRNTGRSRLTYRRKVLLTVIRCENTMPFPG